MRARWLVVAALIGVLLAVSATKYRPDRALRVATAVVAHNTCAKAFVSGQDPATAYAEVNEREGVRAIRPMLRYKFDAVGKTIEVSLLGLFSSRALYREGFGCILLHADAEPYLPKADIAALKASGPASLLAEIAGPAVVEPADPRLKAALDHAFEEPLAPPLRRTKAVVVIHDGRVVAERYATGVSTETPLLGYSLTKSVVNALIGILTQKGLTSPSLPAPIAEWRGATDPRREIEVEHLLRMTTGLALDETNSGLDPSSQMVYLHDDMAAFAAKAPPIAAPGTRWAYSSPSTQLLARIINQLTGGPEQTLKFAWRELFNPLGMRNVTLEFDATGTMQGSSYMYASARDWARFGLLYLQDGVVGGQRMLPEDWVEFSARATLDTDYGAGFWTNRSEHQYAKGRARLGIPRDAFFASGDLGQRIVVLPTQHLVIVRLGDAVDPTGDIRGLGRLVGEVIAATVTPEAAGPK
ncbi:MAG: serine hydrolase [Rhodopseudomonas sp.]|uniref:serine hydrolase domain-containing protein n=1 Tax=Rhodopseudomonas sp. TaxID=1078 RepID=UPI00182BBD71|nr:serine hydrolase [Rhodopseudomonas sp.]NVN85685.1 serine hydrolase [Rhodopseudomonas sp.]